MKRDEGEGLLQQPEAAAAPVERDKKEKKRAGRPRSHAWLWLLVVLPLVYLGIQVARSAHRPYRTQTALPVTLTDSVQLAGVAVRQESRLAQQSEGVVGYIVQDTQRVSVGTEVARVFPTAAAARDFDTLRETQASIDALEAAVADGRNAGTDVDLILQQVDGDMYEYIRLLHTGAYTDLAEVSQTLCYAMNKLDIAVGRQQDFDALLAQLGAQRDALAAAGQQGEPVYAPSTGFFAYGTDGLEGLAPADALQLTPDQLDALDESFPRDTSPAVGRMVDSYRWYFVCVADAATAARFAQGAGVTLAFVDAGVTDVPAVVESVGEPDAQGRVTVALRCERMDARLSELRFETVEVQFATYTGVRIPRTALHVDAQGDRGVYVKFGTMVRFCRITPLFETEAYILVPLQPSAGENEVSLYDEIIVEGTDLYDGKLL